MSDTPEDPSLHLPRLLCLHGGGVNSEAFRLQSRGFISSLKGIFRLVFADGPFFCEAGPGILPVYADHGPFRRWLRWLPEHPPIDAATAIHEIWYQLNDAMDRDDAAGATGPWVGLFGFSQGAKVSASILYEQQVRLAEEAKKKVDGTTTSTPAAGSDFAAASTKERPVWRFAILLAGRAPLVSLCEVSDSNKALISAGADSESFKFIDTDDSREHVLRLPTVHVHGLADPGIRLHRRLLNQYCDPATSRLIEWDGGHRLPFKSVDVQKVTDGILDVAKRTGVL